MVQPGPLLTCLLLAMLVLPWSSPAGEPIAAGQGPTQETLLDTILKNQRSIAQVSGTARRVTLPRPEEGQPRRPGTPDRVTFAIRAPDHYRLDLRPEGRDEVQVFLSDGQRRWKRVRLDADEPFTTSRLGDNDSRAVERLLDFVRLDRAALERDYSLSARTLAEGETRLAGQARFCVELVPRAQLARELRRVEVELDQDHRTVALSLLDERENLIQATVLNADYTTTLADDLFTIKE